MDASIKTTSQIKNIKSQLEHLNGVFYVFKMHSIKKKIDESSQNTFIQELLRNYIKDKKRLVTDKQIKKAKEAGKLALKLIEK